MGREEHHRELATFLAFSIEAVAQVAYLLVLIPTVSSATNSLVLCHSLIVG
jgi:hypothetical protein